MPTTDDVYSFILDAAGEYPSLTEHDVFDLVKFMLGEQLTLEQIDTALEAFHDTIAAQAGEPRTPAPDDGDLCAECAEARTFVKDSVAP